MTTQLTFDAEAARELADRGMADARSGLMDWRERAEYTVFLLWGAGHRFTADDITALIGLPTTADGSPSNNGIGGYLNALARQGRIRRAGYTNSTRTSSHARVLRVWEVQS